MAIVFLSAIRRALETAEMERIRTATAGKNENRPRVPLEARLRSNVAIPEYKRRRGVEGSTKRCLYLLARASVAERFECSSAEEDVDDN